MARRVTNPGRLRRRLTITFVVLTLVSTGALAGGSFLLVRKSRLDESVDRALTQTRLNLRIAQQNLPANPDSAAVGRLLDAYEGAGFETLFFSAPDAFSTIPSIGKDDVPGGLLGLVGDGKLAYQRASVDDRPFVVSGTPVPGRDAQAFFFFSEQQIHSDLSQLGRILLIGALTFVFLAALVGALLARRVLDPVAKASTAARALAEGLLTTRLPVDTRDEFGMWAVSFNEMAQALESKIEALSRAQERERRFTSDVAHELRTPVTALVNEAELLAEHLDYMPPPARRPAELLITDVGRLRRLVADLMEISRLDSDRESVRLETASIGALVAAVIDARGWRLQIDLGAGDVTIHTDRRRLERIVSNLVGNALEHGNSNVRVRVGRRGSNAFVEVADEGPGIPPEHLPHIFERFYKADPSRSGTGSGLGLALARENARLLGGDIDVWSERGRGARFTLLLPVTEPLRAGDPSVSPALHDGVTTEEEGDRK